MNAPAPTTLRSVYRGRGTDELVLVDSDGRAILLRGDGLTDDERIRMRERAIVVLSGGVMTPEQQNGPRRRGNDASSLARQPMPLASHKSTEDVALVSLHQRFTETQGQPGAAGMGRGQPDDVHAVTGKARSGVRAQRQRGGLSA